MVHMITAGRVKHAGTIEVMDINSTVDVTIYDSTYSYGTEEMTGEEGASIFPDTVTIAGVPLTENSAGVCNLRGAEMPHAENGNRAEKGIISEKACKEDVYT